MSQFLNILGGGSGAGSGGGTPFPSVLISKTITVNKAGDDSTGDGTPNKPYLTPSKAAAVILAAADNTAATPYAVILGPGAYSDSFALLPWVWFCGTGGWGGPTGNPGSLASLSPVGGTQLTGVVSLDSTWGNASLQRGGACNLYINQNINSTAAIGSTGMILDLFNVGAQSIGISFRDNGATLNYVDGYAAGVTLTNGYSILKNVTAVFGFQLTSNISSGSSILNLISCNGATVNSNLSAGATASTVNVTGSAMDASSIDGGTINFDADSFPKLSNPSVTNGGTYTLQAAVRVKNVSTQFDKTNTTLADITGLSVPLLAGASYSFRAVLFTTSNIGGGVKAAIASSGTVTSIIYEGLTYSAGTVTQSRSAASGTAVGAVTAVTAATMIIEGTIVANSAGNLTAQFAENVATATSSVLVGSSLSVSRNVT